jgi:hypothetical protein
MGTKIIILDMLLNAQDFSSIRLPPEGMTYTGLTISRSMVDDTAAVFHYLWLLAYDLN